jgi:hypothetical protein
MKQDANKLCGDHNDFEKVMGFLSEKSDLPKPNDDKIWLYKSNINTKFDVNKLIFKSEEIIEKYKLGKPHL